MSFPRDRFAVWASVYTIFALDIFQSIVVACEAWQTLCAGWGRSVNLQFPGWTFTALPIVSSISGCLRFVLMIVRAAHGALRPEWSLRLGADILRLENIPAG